eukprot:CAMPEP_0172551534 /NCGR_PEP_ID=MMETSP1067-20121228/40061_1 /TAXON_ID=265564 ORGANISM="Thalassiosira punctigera, Strain Tpunct2005C2" /NCGR_SAMPLE_ID=MMETSP1067 /ASSEMBLY_ACC=CAM_ASM_000444 /LENGTH=149 /DNA_ID=CAMNT_0013339339 /DNA_START=23 /DNA_END=472 /DNA_ORIENTATION=+
MTVAAVSPSIPSSSPTIERRPRSRSFGAGTPTFSSDLAKLKAACSNDGSTVYTYSEAIAIASSFDVLGSNSPLSRKLKLETEGEWINFINNSGAVVSDDGKLISIHFEKFLRHCFDIAYKMPASPSTKTLRSALNGDGSARVSPTPLQI